MKIDRDSELVKMFARIITEANVLARRIDGNFKEELQKAIDNNEEVTVMFDDGHKVFEESFFPHELTDKNTVKATVRTPFSMHADEFRLDQMIGSADLKKLQNRPSEPVRPKAEDPICKDWGYLNASPKGFSEALKKHEEMCKNDPEHHKMESNSDHHGHNEYFCKCGFKYRIDSSD